MICGGVLVPFNDGTGRWERRCFVETMPLDLFADAWRLKMSVDHFIPKSQGGANGPTHLVHLYCQNVQGGRIAGPRAGKIGGKIGGKTQGRRNVESGHLARISSAAGKIGGRIGGPIALCVRWNINRGKPCTCGRHEESSRVKSAS